MTKLQFEPEDFDLGYDSVLMTKETMANICNAKLAEIKKAWRYEMEVEQKEWQEIYNKCRAEILAELKASATVVTKALVGLWSEKPHPNDILRGYIVCVEEIEKKACEHEPLDISRATFCKHCHVRLKAKWEVVE